MSRTTVDQGLSQTRQAFTVATVQFTARDDDPDGNLEAGVHWATQAALAGADLVVLPELWTGVGYSSRDAHESLAHDIQSGTAQTAMRAVAREHRVHIVGTVYERGEGSTFHNTAVLINDTGQTAATYRKTHLFHAPTRTDLPGGNREADKVEAGNEFVVASTRLGQIGLSICHELRFPEIYRALALNGADLIVNCSAFLAPHLDSWEFLLRARAADNQVFVAASGQFGTEPVSGLRYVGRSMVIDPKGTVIATAPDRPGFALTRIDPALADEARRHLPLRAMRRPELYADTTKPLK